MISEELNHILKDIFDQQSLIMASLSAPKRPSENQKVVIRPVLVKGTMHYQWTDFQHQKALHRNLTGPECREALQSGILAFKQTFLYTSTADYQILIGKKLNVTILRKPPSKAPLSLAHNRPKHYLIEEGHPIPFLIELGVMNKEGKVYSQKRDKFRQINRFIEMVNDVLPALDPTRPLHIVDFGCGKAYLTFALYYYLKFVKGFTLTLQGIDLKLDVIQECRSLAERLGYQDLTFILGDINQYQSDASHVDMVVSLHACDTATDAALEKAIRWQAKVILCVPCCQHELFDQVTNSALTPLLKHGILKERFAALATDAARAQLLEILGYHTQVLEFIEMEHTPKNILIRAVKQFKAKTAVAEKDARKIYLNFKESLQINPSLERRFHQEMDL